MLLKEVLLLIPKVHTCVHKSSPCLCILGQMNLLYVPPSCFFMLSSHLCLGLQIALSFRFPNQNPTCHLPCPSQRTRPHQVPFRHIRLSVCINELVSLIKFVRQLGFPLLLCLPVCCFPSCRDRVACRKQPLKLLTAHRKPMINRTAHLFIMLQPCVVMRPRFTCPPQLHASGLSSVLRMRAGRRPRADG